MITTTKRGEGDDSRPSAMGTEMDSWMDLFQELAEAAEEAGFTTVFMMTGYDPISGQSQMAHGYNGDTYAALGAAITTAEWLKG